MDILRVTSCTDASQQASQTGCRHHRQAAGIADRLQASRRQAAGMQAAQTGCRHRRQTAGSADGLQASQIDFRHRRQATGIADRPQASQTGHRHRRQATGIADRPQTSQTGQRHCRQATGITDRPQTSQAGCRSHRQTVFCMFKLSVYFPQTGAPPPPCSVQTVSTGCRLDPPPCSVQTVSTGCRLDPPPAVSRQCLLGADWTPPPPAGSGQCLRLVQDGHGYVQPYQRVVQLYSLVSSLGGECNRAGISLLVHRRPDRQTDRQKNSRKCTTRRRGGAEGIVRQSFTERERCVLCRQIIW